MGVRRLTDTPLHVAPHYLGVPLASPLRRMTAFGIDVIIVAVPTVVAALLMAGMALYGRDRAAFDAVWNLTTGKADTPDAQSHALRDLLPLLVRLDSRGLSHDVAAMTEQGQVGQAAERLSDYDVRLTLSPGEPADSPLPPKTIELRVDALIPAAVRGIAIFSVPALYFTLFTCGMRGATPGKRLSGIRVVRLDGHPFSWLEGLERFIGYLEIPGTLFIGLLDLWKDPNRRMAHDRVVHTAVVRVDATEQPRNAARGTRNEV